MNAYLDRLAERGWPVLLITALLIIVNVGLFLLADRLPSLAWSVASLCWLVLAVIFIIFGYLAIRRKHAAWELPPVLPSSSRTLHYVMSPLSLIAGIACGALVAYLIDVDILARYRSEPDSIRSAIALLFVPVIATALCEEMLVRGYVLSWISHSLGTVGGVVGSSAIFALYHFYPDKLTIIVTVIGIVLAVMVRVTGCLFHATVFHVGINLMAIFIEGTHMANR